MRDRGRTTPAVAGHPQNLVFMGPGLSLRENRDDIA